LPEGYGRNKKIVKTDRDVKKYLIQENKRYPMNNFSDFSNNFYIKTS